MKMHLPGSWQGSWLVVFCVVVITGCASAPPTPQRGVTSLTRHISDGGQEFVLAAMPDANEVTVQLIWPNDYAHGMSMPVVGNLGVELMSSGSAGKRTAKKIKQAMTALGSVASIVATPDHIYGTFTASPQTLDETLEIVSDVINDPALDGLRFGVVKDAKRKRIEAQQGKLSSVLWSAARAALLGDSTLTDYWNNTPVSQVIDPITDDDVRSWHKGTFTQKDVTVAVAGNINAARAGEKIDALLSALPVDRPSRQAIAPTLKTGVTVLLHDESALVTLFAAIGLLPPSRAGGEITDIIAVGALGKGKDSRLLQHKNEAPENGTTIGASIANFSRAVRVFGINASADNDQAVSMIQVIEDAYSSFRDGNLDEEEVLRSVVPFANSLQSSRNKADLLAHGLGQLLLDDLPAELLLTVMQDALALKADDINQRISTSYPTWDNMIKVVLSSDEALVEADCVVKRVEEIYACDF